MINTLSGNESRRAKLHKVQEGKQETIAEHPSFAGTADWKGLWATLSPAIKSSNSFNRWIQLHSKCSQVLFFFPALLLLLLEYF